MAITTPVVYGTGSAADGSADVTVTLSGALPASTVCFAAISINRATVSTVAPTSVTGGGITWTLETDYAYDVSGGVRGGVYVYRGVTASPSGTTVTFAVGYTYNVCTAIVFTVPGAVTTTNGADCITQGVTNTAASLGTVAAAMNTAASADNAFVVVGAYANDTGTRTFVADTSPVMTIPSGGQASAANGAATRQSGVMTEYVLGNTDTNPSLSYTFSSGVAQAIAIVAYEIAAASGPTITVQPTAQTKVLTNANTATFSVTATGTGSLTYDWELEDGVASGVYANVANGNGATWTGQAAASLVGTFTAKTLSGRRVRCNVTDDNGTTTTDAVTLTLFDGPQVTAFGPTDGSSVSTATLTCDYVTGTGEAIEVAIVLPDGRVAVTTTTTA